MREECLMKDLQIKWRSHFRASKVHVCMFYSPWLEIRSWSSVLKSKRTLYH